MGFSTAMHIWPYGAIPLAILTPVVAFAYVVTCPEDDRGRRYTAEENLGHFFQALVFGLFASALWELALTLSVIVGIPYAIFCAIEHRRSKPKPEPKLLEPTSADDLLCSCPKCGLLSLHEAKQVAKPGYDEYGVDLYEKFNYVPNPYRLRPPMHTQRTCIFCGHVWRTPGKQLTG